MKRKEAPFLVPLRAENETRITFCISLMMNDLRKLEKTLGVK